MSANRSLPAHFDALSSPSNVRRYSPQQISPSEFEAEPANIPLRSSSNGSPVRPRRTSNPRQHMSPAPALPLPIAPASNLPNPTGTPSNQTTNTEKRGIILHRSHSDRSHNNKPINFDDQESSKASPAKTQRSKSQRTYRPLKNPDHHRSDPTNLKFEDPLNDLSDTRSVKSFNSRKADTLDDINPLEFMDILEDILLGKQVETQIPKLEQQQQILQQQLEIQQQKAASRKGSRAALDLQHFYAYQQNQAHNHSLPSSANNSLARSTVSIAPSTVSTMSSSTQSPSSRTNFSQQSFDYPHPFPNQPHVSPRHAIPQQQQQFFIPTDPSQLYTNSVSIEKNLTGDVGNGGFIGNGHMRKASLPAVTIQELQRQNMQYQQQFQKPIEPNYGAHLPILQNTEQYMIMQRQQQQQPKLQVKHLTQRDPVLRNPNLSDGEEPRKEAHFGKWDLLKLKSAEIQNMRKQSKGTELAMTFM